jgi:hypothetical protein
VKEKVNTLPKGGVLLCYAQENSRQRRILARIEETFKQQGHAVRSVSMREVYNTTPWLFRCLISASIHAHFQPMLHESASYSRGYEHAHRAL